MKPSRVRLVAEPAAPKLREVNEVTAAGLYPASPTLQQRWLDAIRWLRRDTPSRWVLDDAAPRWHAHD